MSGVPCYVIKRPDGGTAMVRTGNTPGRGCCVCKRKTNRPKLCDFPVGPQRRCDAVLCEACATHVEPDTDYCPPHAAAAAGKLKL